MADLDQSLNLCYAVFLKKSCLMRTILQYEKATKFEHSSLGWRGKAGLHGKIKGNEAQPGKKQAKIMRREGAHYLPTPSKLREQILNTTKILLQKQMQNRNFKDKDNWKRWWKRCHMIGSNHYCLPSLCPSSLCSGVTLSCGTKS